MIKKVFFGFFLIFSVLLSAQYKENYAFEGNLNQAIEYALSNSYSIYNSKLDLEIMNKSFWEGASVYLPKIKAELTYTNNLITPLSLVPASAFDQTNAVIQTLEKYYELKPKKEYKAPEGYLPISFSTKQDLRPTLNISQLILDLEAISSISLAKIYMDLQNDIHFKNEVNTVSQVKNTYVSILVFKDRTQILKNNKKVLNQILKEADNKYSLGLIDKESVDKIRIKLFQLDNNIKKSFREGKALERLLKFIMGINLDEKIKLTDTVNKLIENINVLESFDIGTNIDYSISKNNRDIAYKNISINRAKFFPKLTFKMSLGANLSGDEIDLVGFKKEDWLVYSNLVFKLEIPIFNGSKNIYSFQKAKINYDKSIMEHKIVEQKINTSFKDTYNNLLMSVDVFRTSEKNLYLSQTVLNKEKIKFKNGTTTSSNLLQFQNDFYSVQNEYILSVLDVFKYSIELDKLMGKTI